MHIGKFAIVSVLVVFIVSCANVNHIIYSDSFNPSPAVAVDYQPDQGRIKDYSKYRVKVAEYASPDDLPLNVTLQTGHTDISLAITYSRDGRYLAVGDRAQSIKIWNIESGKEVKTLYGHQGMVDSLVFSPDGLTLASGDMHGYIKIWDIVTGELLRELYARDTSVDKLVFSATGEQLFSYDNTKGLAIRWDVHSGEEIQTYNQGGLQSSMALSPDNKILAVSAGEVGKGIYIKLLNVDTGSVLKTYRGHINHVGALDFSPDSRFLASGGAATLRIWDLQNDKEIHAINWSENRVGNDSFSSIQFSPDGRYIAAGSYKSGGLKLWQVSSGQSIKEFQQIGTGVTALAFSPDGNNLTASFYDGKVATWHIQSASEPTVLVGETEGIYAVAASPNGYLVASGNGIGVIFIWDIRSGQLINRLKGHTASVNGLAFSPDGKRLVSASSDTTIRYWDVDSGQQTRLIDEHIGPVHTVVFSPDGEMFVTTSVDETVRIWDVASGQQIKKFRDRDETYYALSFSPDGKRLVAGGLGGRLVVWDVSSGNEVYAEEIKYLVSIKSLSHSPSGNQLLVGGGQHLQIRDSNAYTLTAEGQPHYRFINAIDFTNDGELLLTAGGDATMRIFAMKTGMQVAQFLGHKTHIQSATFTADDRYVISGSEDGTIKLWHAETGKQILSMTALNNGEWISNTPDFYFTSSVSGARSLGVNRGMEIYEIDQFFDALYRPDIVAARINYENTVAMNKLSKSAKKIHLQELLKNQAPSVSFVDAPSGLVKYRDIDFTVLASDQGGGIGKVIWKNNGVIVAVEESPNSLPRLNNGTIENIQITIDRALTLSPGRNVIEVMVYNNDGSMHSQPAVVKLNVKDNISEKPDLHILSVGINRYRDKALWLNYAVPDAKELANQFKKSGNSVFDSIHITHVLDENASMSGIREAFSRVSEAAKTNDVFILFLAGHGITVDGRYHFIPVDFRYRNEDSVRENAINQDHLQKWMAQIPALKSLVLLDTCNSGSYVEAQTVYRGISEKTAIDKLIRATGRATISASSDSQVALEGIENHGVFTYALMRALEESDQKHGNRDGTVTTSEIANYIDEAVPHLTYGKWGYEQVPQVNLHGRPFPVGVSLQ